MPIRTGAQYIERLKTERDVWIDGMRVSDVTTYPAFVRPIASIANLYDMQDQQEWRTLLTYPSPETGAPVGISFLQPATYDDLSKRRRGIKAWADATFGLMGRSPDFLNTAVMAFASAKDFFAQADKRFANNVVEYYKLCRDNDLFLAHAVINPQVDRSKAPSEQEDPFAYLRIVRKTEDGLIVRGAKMIGTLAPIADELLVFPLPGLRPGDEPYALAFSIPVSTPGLRLICREPFDRGERSLFDHPLSSRFEEMDAACIFDDVLVPWERVFLFEDIELANILFDATYGRHHTGHQGIIRGLAKAELLTGIAIKLAEVARTDTYLHVQEMLGELLGYLELVEGAIQLAERKAGIGNWGTIYPAIEPILALRYHFPKMYKRMVEVVQILGAGSLLSSPVEKDFHALISEDIQRYFRGSNTDAHHRVQLLKLAWDATGDSFGQRQVLYERYHAGDPVRLAATQYSAYDKSSLERVVERVFTKPVEP